ncbi:MAG: hypothetical protein V4631_00850 [Pseudomonadota bacterium]
MKKLILICAALLLSACGGGGGGAGGGVVVPTPTPVPTTPAIDAFFTLISSVVANSPDDSEAGDLANIPVVEPDTTEAVEL